MITKYHKDVCHLIWLHDTSPDDSELLKRDGRVDDRLERNCEKDATGCLEGKNIRMNKPFHEKDVEDYECRMWKKISIYLIRTNFRADKFLFKFVRSPILPHVFDKSIHSFSKKPSLLAFDVSYVMSFNLDERKLISAKP